MKLKRFVSFFVVMTIMICAYAENDNDFAATSKITGTVINIKGEAMSGVTVRLKGNPSVMSITDIDGRFAISVPDLNASLVASFIGYSEKTVRIKGRDDIVIVLREAEGSIKYEYELLAGGGVSLMSWSDGISVFNSNKPVYNFQIGVAAKTWLGLEQRWGVSLGCRWEIKGVSSDVNIMDYDFGNITVGNILGNRLVDNVKVKYRSQQIVIPLTVLFRLNQRITFNIGPCISYAFTNDLNCDVYDGDLNEKYLFNGGFHKSQWGILGGVSWLFHEHWAINANLQWDWNGNSESSFKTISLKQYPFYIDVSLAYVF